MDYINRTIQQIRGRIDMVKFKREKLLMVVVTILMVATLLGACSNQGNINESNEELVNNGDTLEETDVDTRGGDTDDHNHIDPSEVFEGQTVDNFILQSLTGREVQLDDYKGKIVLLNFWTSWCPWCEEELPELQKFYEDYGKDVEVIAINFLEEEETIINYIEDKGYTFEALLDSDGKVGIEQFLVEMLPTNIFIGTDGTILKYIPGSLNYSDMEEIYKEIAE